MPTAPQAPPAELCAADSGPVSLHARDVVFDFSQSPLEWIPGEAVASHTISALNLMLPVGEKMFVEIFGRALPHIKDEQLRQDVIGFIGQEQIHASTHDHALSEFFVNHGIDVAAFTASCESFLEVFRTQLDRLSAEAEYRIVVFGVGMIAGLEHFTATGGDWLLNHDFEKYGADPVITDMFRWHGAEEVEHRSVAYDLARHLGVSRGTLVAQYIAMTGAVLSGLVVGGALITKGDPRVPNVGPITALRLATKAMNSGSLFSWKMIGSAFRAYLRPDFTPESIGSTAQAVAYLAKSPAAKAASHA
ncbi:metal-dependent hydrolase [Gordonia malaquae]|uniref:metal-dependent hydrolase n=1 Tax=Gordonia malaquae TaxID=410332 RepID=UPI0030FDFD2C